jgi:hypothetical protein
MKIREEGNFKPFSSNESVHEANIAISKHLLRAKHVHTATFINTLGVLLMVSHIIR